MNHRIRSCAATTLLLLTSGSVAISQETDAPGVPPAMANTQPANEPATPAPVIPAGQITDEGKLLLNFQNASLDSVLSFLSQASGIVVIGETKVKGRVSVMSRHPVSIDQALDILNAVLKDNGYAAVRQGQTLRIVTLDAAKKANIEVRSGNDPDAVPESDQVFTQVIPIRYADAAQLKKDLAQLVPAYADLASNVSTNTLILTDTSSNIKRMLKIIRSLDTAVSAVTRVRVFPLKYANATNAAKLIGEVFKTDQTTSSSNTSQQNRGPMAFFPRFGPGGPQPAGNNTSTASSEGSRPQVKVTASADDRTNTVVVSAPADTMPVIEQVLKELDANPAQDQAVFTYYLKNADATNVQNVINSLFGTGTTSSGTSSRNTSVSGLSSSSFSSSSNSRSSGSMGLNTSNFGSSNTNTSRSSASASLPTRSGTSQSTTNSLSGQILAVADVDTNSVMVLASSTNYERVKQVILDMDRPVPQVLIKVLLAEVTHSNDVDLGVELAGLNLTAGEPTAGMSSISTKLGGAGGLKSLQTANGGLMYQYISGDFSANIRALQTIGKVEVLSRPYILSSDNQTSSIIVGQSVPLITDSRVDTNNNTINTIQYQDVGIILNVTPHISPDGVVIMDVSPEISQQLESSVELSPGVKSPVFSLRAAKTRVAIRDSQTIVIGGLMQDEKNQNVSQIPLLGDIPLLGELFKRNRNNKSKTELLIFLTPHVAKEPDRLQGMSDSERQGAKIIPGAITPGVFDEHLQGMQRGAAESTSQPASQPADPE